MRVLFFGDSITQGLYDSQGGWAQRLINELHMRSLELLGKKDTIEAFNLGISGDTAEGLAKRIKQEIEARLWPGEDYVIVVAIGTNDAILRDNRAVMDVYAFQEVFEKVIDTAANYTDKILCVGLTAVDESLTDPVRQSSTGEQYHNQRLNVFEDTIKQSATRKQVGFVPVHDTFLAKLEAGTDILSDGLHPNDLGHKLVYALVKPDLEKLLN